LGILFQQPVRDSLFGGIATKFIENAHEVDLRVQVERRQISNTSELLAMEIPRSNQKALTLNTLVETKADVEKSKIFRLNKKRLVSLTVKRKTDDLESFLTLVDQKLSNLPLPPGVRYQFGEEVKTYERGRNELYFGIALSVLLTFMLMASLFQNIKAPFLILTSIPFALIGVIWTHFIFHLSFSFPVYLGILMLSGITVNHSLLLVDSIFRKWKKAKLENNLTDLSQATDQGLRERIRPILLTAGTALVALLPIILFSGDSGQWFQALAITLFSGTLVSLLISLIVIPIYFGKIFNSKPVRN
jgi:HAE1 family hydrophobic/amphiphilic exporter-1